MRNGDFNMKNSCYLGKNLRRRSGIVLVLVLLFILVGTTCTILLFDATYRFSWINQFHKHLYADHVTALDAIRDVKEYILKTNSANGKIMHPTGFDYASHDITHLNIIRFFDSDLNGERFVKNEGGIRRLEISVYDLSYDDFRRKGTSFDPEKYGVYLVRVKLYAVDQNDSEPLHLTEEAFVQVLR
jgi:hypothetical protein